MCVCTCKGRGLDGGLDGGFMEELNPYPSVLCEGREMKEQNKV